MWFRPDPRIARASTSISPSFLPPPNNTYHSFITLHLSPTITRVPFSSDDFLCPSPQPPIQTPPLHPRGLPFLLPVNWRKQKLDATEQSGCVGVGIRPFEWLKMLLYYLIDDSPLKRCCIRKPPTASNMMEEQVLRAFST